MKTDGSLGLELGGVTDGAKACSTLQKYKNTKIQFFLGGLLLLVGVTNQRKTQKQTKKSKTRRLRLSDFKKIWQ